MTGCAARCECGWSQDYTTKATAQRGLEQHQARRCDTFAPTVPRQRDQAAKVDEWRERTVAAGYPTERSVEEWLAHPYALDDLMRVLSGTAPNVIGRERAKLRRRAG